MRKSNGFSARQLTNSDLHPLLCGVALNICEFFDIEVSEFFESTLPSPATRELRRELQDLSDEDLNCLIHIVKRMKGTDT